MRAVFPRPVRTDKRPVSIRLAPGLPLPLDAVTQTYAILGKRGSGKTTTATILTEELLENGQHVVIIDPLDVTWGLRSSRDGKSAGYPITVLGGDHADLPLEATAGTVLAEFVVEHHAHVILSLRHFSLNDQRRFVTDFAERLYSLKGKQSNRVPVHLVIDEVDEFAHQRIPKGHERLFGAIDRLVRRGRASGIGVTMISQRPAVIHKDILSQAEVLICHQTISPQDRKALESWIEAHDAHGQRDEFMQTIATLQRGEAWVWSPGWLDIFKRVQIRDRRTFDSSSTPKSGERVHAPKMLAPVDLNALQARIQATIERAKQDDPRELKKQIAALEAKLRTAPAPSERVVEKPVIDPKVIAEVGKQLGRLERVAEAVGKIAAPMAELRKTFHVIQQVMENVRISAAPRTVTAIGSIGGRARAAALPPERRSEIAKGAASARWASSNGHLNPGERAILIAVAQHPGGVTREHISVLTAYKRSSRDTYIQKLSSRGLVEVMADQVVATESGIATLGDDYNPLPTGLELQRYWLERLPEGERKILGAVIARYPNGIERDEIDAETGYKRSSRDTYLQKLKTRQLITTSGGRVRASERLF